MKLREPFARVTLFGVFSLTAAWILAAPPARRSGESSETASPVRSARSGAPSVAAGDLNADRTLDLVLVDHEGPVSVRLGRGDGTFTAAAGVDAGYGAASAAIGDLDGDGNQDLAVVNRESGTLHFFMGYGDGTFGRESLLQVGDLPAAVAVTDFDGDGRLDLAVTDSGSNEISVLLGSEEGQGAVKFSAERRFKVGGNPQSLTIGDFNGDGRQDLVVANQRSNSLSMLFGAPAAGDFLAQKRLRVGKAPDDLVAADFNKDGVQDLAVVNRGSSDMSVLIGTGGGRFKSDTRYGFIGPVATIAAGDFNSDTLPDLAVVVTGRDVYFLRSIGDGSFRSGSSGLGFSPVFLSVGDFDADGKQDLLTAGDSGAVSTWFGRGDGVFQPRAAAGSGR